MVKLKMHFMFLLIVFIPKFYCAPLDELQTEIESYNEGQKDGCMYNLLHYNEGQRITTNEPCLNCTCHDRMLRCYLRVCPFVKAIGQECVVEQSQDQCCPKIICPEVPVPVITSTSTTERLTLSNAALASYPNRYSGCSIGDRWYTNGARIEQNSQKPCEICYCIRNQTACIMQECTLNVPGCKPVYKDGFCCPVKYECDEVLQIETTEVTSLSPIMSTLPPLRITTIAASKKEPMTIGYGTGPGCYYKGQQYAEGDLVESNEACEHCYCMKGNLVCAVRNCGQPLENHGNCKAVPNARNQCCPETYICDNEIYSIETSTKFSDTIIVNDSFINRDLKESSVVMNEGNHLLSEDFVHGVIFTPSPEQIAIVNEVLEKTAELEKSNKESKLENGSVNNAIIIKPSTVLEDDGDQSVESISTISSDSIQTASELHNDRRTVEAAAAAAATTAATAAAANHNDDANVNADQDNNKDKIEIEKDKIDDRKTNDKVHDAVHSSVTFVDETALPSQPEPAITTTTTNELKFDEKTENQIKNYSVKVNEKSSKSDYDGPIIVADIAGFDTEIKMDQKQSPELSIENLITETEKNLIDQTKSKDEHRLSHTEYPVDQKTLEIYEIGSERPSSSLIHETYETPELIDNSKTVPGEGSCLIDNETYRNDSFVPVISRCQLWCKCISSIVRCETVQCPDPPPRQLVKCSPIMKNNDCCPIYSCDKSNDDSISPTTATTTSIETTTTTKSNAVDDVISVEPTTDTVEEAKPTEQNPIDSNDDDIRTEQTVSETSEAERPEQSSVNDLENVQAAAAAAAAATTTVRSDDFVTESNQALNNEIQNSNDANELETSTIDSNRDDDDDAANGNVTTERMADIVGHVNSYDVEKSTEKYEIITEKNVGNEGDGGDATTAVDREVSNETVTLVTLIDEIANPTTESYDAEKETVVTTGGSVIEIITEEIGKTEVATVAAGTASEDVSGVDIDKSIEAEVVYATTASSFVETENHSDASDAEINNTSNDVQVTTASSDSRENEQATTENVTVNEDKLSEIAGTVEPEPDRNDDVNVGNEQVLQTTEIGQDVVATTASTAIEVGTDAPVGEVAVPDVAEDLASETTPLTVENSVKNESVVATDVISGGGESTEFAFGNVNQFEIGSSTVHETVPVADVEVEMSAQTTTAKISPEVTEETISSTIKYVSSEEELATLLTELTQSTTPSTMPSSTLASATTKSQEELDVTTAIDVSMTDSPIKDLPATEAIVNETQPDAEESPKSEIQTITETIAGTTTAGEPVQETSAVTESVKQQSTVSTQTEPISVTEEATKEPTTISAEVISTEASAKPIATTDEPITTVAVTIATEASTKLVPSTEIVTEAMTVPMTAPTTTAATTTPSKPTTTTTTPLPPTTTTAVTTTAAAEVAETTKITPAQTSTAASSVAGGVGEPDNQVPVENENESETSNETEDEYDDLQSQLGPGTCRYSGKVYVSAQQIPRDNPCDFCFCFRGDIICLEQKCPPPIRFCKQEPIDGYCCPRFECPILRAVFDNSTLIAAPARTTTTTTTTTTSRPRYYYRNGTRVQKKGCQFRGKAYQVHEEIKAASGPCLSCICGKDGQMQCNPKVCTPSPTIDEMIHEAYLNSNRKR